MPLGFTIGAVVTAGVAAYDAYQQTGIQDTAMGMAQTQFGEQQQYAGMLYNLINNPSSITSTPGYQFQEEQGADAVAREMGASGMLGSGNEGIALQQYGQNFASSALTQQEQLLAGLSGLQTTSANSNLLNTGSGAGSAAFNQEGQLLASLAYQQNAGGYGSAGGAGSYSWAGSQDSMNMPNIYATGYAGTPA